jgi:Cys-rich protein (TIGR01571 family)
MRTKIRLMLGIRGSICNDCINATFCGPCVVCQMKRELDSAGWPK